MNVKQTHPDSKIYRIYRIHDEFTIEGLNLRVIQRRRPWVRTVLGSKVLKVQCSLAATVNLAVSKKSIDLKFKPFEFAPLFAGKVCPANCKESARRSTQIVISRGLSFSNRTKNKHHRFVSLPINQSTKQSLWLNCHCLRARNVKFSAVSKARRLWLGDCEWKMRKESETPNVQIERIRSRAFDLRILEKFWFFENFLGSPEFNNKIQD